MWGSCVSLCARRSCHFIHSSYTTHLTQFITHNSSYTAHHSSHSLLSSSIFPYQFLLLVASSYKLNMWGYLVLLFSLKARFRYYAKFKIKYNQNPPQKRISQPNQLKVVYLSIYIRISILIYWEYTHLPNSYHSTLVVAQLHTTQNKKGQGSDPMSIYLLYSQVYVW